ncbi:hypothetical protein BTH42_32650 [Burkholderia sp. SRS-W-2-2016]|nr:hypothetical protein BTH42_32650 [Burkholderia sp. SRS-W-2-2016]
MKHCTVVAIAHRLSTLQSFDRIVVLNRGQIVQQGMPAELAAVPGIYRDTLARQTRRPPLRQNWCEGGSKKGTL